MRAFLIELMRIFNRNNAVWPETSLRCVNKIESLSYGNRVAVYFIVTPALRPSVPLEIQTTYREEGQSEKLSCCSTVAEKSGADVTAVQHASEDASRPPGEELQYSFLLRVVHRVSLLVVSSSSSLIHTSRLTKTDNLAFSLKFQARAARHLKRILIKQL